MTGPERQAILLKFADLIEAKQEKLAALTRVTLGAPYHPFGKSEIGTAITCFRCECCLDMWKETRVLADEGCVDYAGWVDKFGGQTFPADDGFYKIVRNDPLGVVAG